MYDVPTFFGILTKGNNFCDFLFASLPDNALPKWALLLKEIICSSRRKMIFKSGPLKRMGRVNSLESVFIHLKSQEIYVRLTDSKWKITDFF